MAAPAEDRLARTVKRLALVFALSVGIGLPCGYFVLQYSIHVQHVEITAEVKAQGLTALVAANPELWVYQLQRVEELLVHYPPQLVDDRVIVRDAAGNPLVTVGVPPPAPVLVRSSALYDSGRVVGRVEITHSYRDLLFGMLAAGLLGLLLGGSVYAMVIVLPLRALRQQMALIAQSAELAIALAAATESDRMKSEFMSNVTHELRTPLNSVIGFAELLKEEVAGPLNAKQAGFAADILAGGQRLLALGEGVLEMSRRGAAGAALAREPVEIGAVLEERVAAHRMAAEAREVNLRLEVAPDAGSTELAPKALRRMLDALLDNAIKFNREGGAVAVSARRVDGVLEIAVADMGIGIAREDLGKLFRPLVQLDAGLARRHGGVGLGLALARRLAELHGGTIEVESETGKGSTFTLRFPLQEKS